MLHSSMDPDSPDIDKYEWHSMAASAHDIAWSCKSGRRLPAGWAALESWHTGKRDTGKSVWYWLLQLRLVTAIYSNARTLLHAVASTHATANTILIAQIAPIVVSTAADIPATILLIIHLFSLLSGVPFSFFSVHIVHAFCLNQLVYLQAQISDANVEEKSARKPPKLVVTSAAAIPAISSFAKA